MTARRARVFAGGLPSSRKWLLAGEPERFRVLRRFAPGPTEGFSAVLMTRERTPLLAGPVDEATQILSFVDAASDLLWQLNPANPQSARDRRHYLRAVRPVSWLAAPRRAGVAQIATEKWSVAAA